MIMTVRDRDALLNFAHSQRFWSAVIMATTGSCLKPSLS